MAAKNLEAIADGHAGLKGIVVVSDAKTEDHLQPKGTEYCFSALRRIVSYQVSTAATPNRVFAR
jgi:hypothetical protein